MAQKKTPIAASLSPASPGSASADVTLDRLLGALPDQPDLVHLRRALLRASVSDAARAWSRSSAYATVDKRVVDAVALETAVTEARAALHAHVDGLYTSMSEVLACVTRGDVAGAAQRLVAAGEALEAQENYPVAAAYYDVAARFSGSVPEPRTHILALRRLARALGMLGKIDEAVSLFKVSLEEAEANGDTEAQVYVHLGLGNIFGFQGRWHESIRWYGNALNLCGEEFPRLRGQIRTNLSVMYRETGDFENCAAHLGAASSLWDALLTADHSVWFNGRGLLALELGELDTAETFLRQALDTAGSDFDRAMVLDNLAELYIRRGSLADAESYARAAEEVALDAGWPRALAEIYTRLGKIFRLREDLNGVTFFEKALEICRGHSYPLTEANAYLEYGIFRRTVGDVEEARSYLEQARHICAELGAAQLESVASAELARL